MAPSANELYLTAASTQLAAQANNGTPQPVGTEFRVNTYTQGPQLNPSVAALAGGGFVVTWESWDQDGSYVGIYGQRYDAAGNRVGGEFRANTYTQDWQGDPHLFTFDGLYYDFQAIGDFVLVRALDSDLEVQVRQGPWSAYPETTLNVGLATVIRPLA